MVTQILSDQKIYFVWSFTRDDIVLTNSFIDNNSMDVESNAMA